MAGTAAGIRMGRAFIEIGANQTALDKGLSAATAKLRSFGAGVQSLGMSLARAGVAAGVPVALAGKTFADFESAMARVRAITNASGEDFAKLGALAKKLGADTIFSAAQAAQAMGNFAQAGFSVKEIMEATGPTLDLAATAQIEIAEAASIAAKVMRGMGISAENLGTVIDVLAKAATTANTDITMLGDAFKFVGPIAKVAGVSIEEITAAIQLLSNAGIQGEMAGTTLRGMILTLTSPGEDAAKMLAALGIQVQDSRGNFRGLTDVLKQFQKALAGMGNAQRLEVLGRIFPDRQAAGAAELVAQGAERLAEATKKLGGAAGTAARVAGIQMDTLKGSVDILVSSVEGFAIEVGESLAPTLRRWGTILTAVANGLAVTVKNNREFIVTVAKGVVAVTAIGAALVTAGVAIKGLAAVFGTVAVAVRSLTVAFGVLNAAVSILGGLAAVFSFATSTAGLLTIAVAGLAVWLVRAGTAGDFIAGLGEHFDKLKATAMAAFQGIVNALKRGDLALAGKIAMAGLKVEWLRGTQALNEIWADWGVATRQGFADTSFDIARSFSNWTADLQKFWAQMTFEMSAAWGQLIERMIKNFVPFGETILKFWESLGFDVGEFGDKLQFGLGLGEIPGFAKRDRDAKLNAIEDARKAQQKAIDDQQAADTGKRRKAADDALARANAELKKAQDELDALNKKAAGPGKPIVEPPATPLGGFPRKKAPGLPGLGLDAEGLAQGLAFAQQTVTSRGTFNAAAIAGLGLGDTLSKDQLKEQKKASKELEKLNDRARQGRLVFTA